MIVNGDGEDITSGLVDNTEAIASALLDVDHSPRNFRSSLETANTIDGATVRDRDNTSSNVAVEQRRRGLLPPISNLNDLNMAFSSLNRLKSNSAYSVDVINVVQSPVRVDWIVDNQRPTESLYSMN